MPLNSSSSCRCPNGFAANTSTSQIGIASSLLAILPIPLLFLVSFSSQRSLASPPAPTSPFEDMFTPTPHPAFLPLPPRPFHVFTRSSRLQCRPRPRLSPSPVSLSHQHHHSSPSVLRILTSNLLTTTATAAVFASLLIPRPVRAAERSPTITMTDQVPNFTLPSQEAAIRRANDNTLLVRTLSIAKRVVPLTAIVAFGVWGVSKLVKRAQEKQLRDFQTQLQSFSSMLDLDSASGKEDTPANNPKIAKQIFDATSERYKFRNDNVSTDDDLSSKVRLDLFRAAESSDQPAKEHKTAIEVEVSEAVPQSDFEKAIAQCVVKVETGDEAAKTAALETLKNAREAAGLSDTDAKTVFDSFLSRIVSAQIDRAAVNIDSDDKESLKNLHHLALTMNTAKVLGPNAALTYNGAHAEQEETREALYRRYAVFSLSSEERVRDGLQSLDDMQRLLSVTDERAETINTEIAKGMFQLAVSAAMADGSMKDTDREALDRLKDSFGELLEEESAESITSEVAVMRAMYALQQLLQEQGVTADDVKQMRKMCKDLGVDIEDMLRNADTLGNALGPEAKQFVENLRTLLSDVPDGDSDMVTTTATTTDLQQGSAPPDSP